jgi:hypothetical protein
MVRSREMAWICAAALVLPLMGCGETAVDLVIAEDGGADSDSDTDSDADADTDTGTDTDAPPDLVRAQIVVPEWFVDTPARLTTSFFSEEHMPPDGPPDGVGASYDSPAISKPPDPPYELWTQQPGLDGPYYLVVTLFVEGGGTDVPVPGVDWVGSSETPIELGPGTGTVPAGQIHLNLAPP